MATDQEQAVQIMVEPLLGLNTAIQPTSLKPGQWRYLLNAYQRIIGTNTKRPGTVPVTTSALAAIIKYLTEYKSSPSSVAPDLLATSGTTLYKYNGTTALTAQTMTNALVTSDIYSVGFTDAANVSVLFITDGGSVKQYDGTVVKNVVAAADDPLPAFPNNLTAINALLPVYCWVYQSHIFMSAGKDIAWYSKRFNYNYFPTNQWQRWVRDNDYITGPGISYGNLCLLPMRRGWGVITGSTVDDFKGNQFLNTTNGCIAPRAIAKTNYLDGTQTVVYLSDDGVYEVFDTGYIDASGSGTRQYATRSLMKDKIDFTAVGFTDAEKQAALGYYDDTLNAYILLIKRSTTNYAYLCDTRTKEWYLWDNIKAESIIRHSGILYYAGADMLLRKFDTTLADDWADAAKTTSVVIDWDNISDVIALENSGFASILDYVILWGKQYATSSSIDVYIITFASTDEYDKALQSSYMTWDVSLWDTAVWANLDFTDLVGAPPRIKIKKKSFYFQIRFRNNRAGELVEMYKYKLIARGSGQ
jgi:hypothetical protein